MVTETNGMKPQELTSEQLSEFIFEMASASLYIGEEKRKQVLKVLQNWGVIFTDGKTN